MLDLTTFCRRLVDLLELDMVETPNPYADIFDDLGLDSLQAFQIIVIVESLAGVSVPMGEPPEIFTLGDAYEYYESLALDS